MAAMLGMKKIDIEALERAAEQVLVQGHSCLTGERGEMWGEAFLVLVMNEVTEVARRRAGEEHWMFS